MIICFQIELLFNNIKLYSMSIKRVWLDESENECISCGLCEATCPEVFEVPEKMMVKDGVDFSQHEKEIIDAVEGCPSEVIKYE